MDKNLKNVFNTEYSENILTDFVIKTQKVYEFFNYDFNLKPFEKTTENVYNNKLWLNEKYINSLISNLEIITFDMYYPKLLSKLIETNLENFNVIYSKLLELYYLDKNISLRKYINTAYGCLQNPKCLIHSNNIHLIPKTSNEILDNILFKFKEYIVYINVDNIFFRNFNEIRESFEKYININKYRLTYYSTKSDFGLFLAKRQYIIEQNGYIKTVGIRHFSNDGMFKNGYINIKRIKGEINNE